MRISKKSKMNQQLIDQLSAGPHLAGYSIYHNDVYHHLQVNGRLVRLTPTEYLLCMRLFRHIEWLQQFALHQNNSRGEVPKVYISFEELLRCSHLTKRWHVTKHVSNANGKLKIHGLAIICVGGCGYTLDFL